MSKWLLTACLAIGVLAGCNVEESSVVQTVKDEIIIQASNTLKGSLGFTDEQKEEIKVYVEGLNVSQETKDAIIEIVYGASVSGQDVISKVGADNIIEGVSILLGFLEDRTHEDYKGHTSMAGDMVISTLQAFLDQVCEGDEACKSGTLSEDKGDTDVK